MRARLLLALLAAPGLACAAGNEFNEVVKAIETHFGATRTHIPLMGVANLALQVARPAGASGFHLAIFEDLHIDPDGERRQEIDRFMDGLASPELRPLIRTRSRSRGEATYMFSDASGDSGKTAKVLIATFNQHEATVVEVRINFDTLVRWIQDPAGENTGFRGLAATEPQ